MNDAEFLRQLSQQYATAIYRHELLQAADEFDRLQSKLADAERDYAECLQFARHAFKPQDDDNDHCQRCGRNIRHPMHFG